MISGWSSTTLRWASMAQGRSPTTPEWSSLASELSFTTPGWSSITPGWLSTTSEWSSTTPAGDHRRIRVIPYDSRVIICDSSVTIYDSGVSPCDPEWSSATPDVPLQLHGEDQQLQGTVSTMTPVWTSTNPSGEHLWPPNDTLRDQIDPLRLLVFFYNSRMSL